MLIQSLSNDLMSNVTFTVGMNNGLYFTVTLVVLAWLSASTCRASNTTQSPTTTGTLPVTTATASTTATATDTTVAATTAEATLVPNNTVSELQVGRVKLLKANSEAAIICKRYNNFFSFQTEVTNEECGITRLCVGAPSGCNPASGSCTLIGVKQVSTSIYNFLLAGESSGYLASVTSFTGELVQ